MLRLHLDHYVPASQPASQRNNHAVSKRSPAGFTLIELSIVLTIIGLVIGGALVGRDLIAVAQVRATIAQYDQYKTAVNEFRTKYNCIPGDCIDATDYGLTTNVTNGPNSNGNGNRQVNFNAAPAGWAGEQWQFWTHLAQAGFIPSATQTLKVDHASLNRPLYKTNGGWWVIYVPEMTMNGTFFGNAKSHVFMLITTFYVSGGCPGGGGGNCRSSIITPITAYAIDSKIDDGLPGTGGVTAGPDAIDANSAWYYGDPPNCRSGNPWNYLTTGTYSTQFGCTLALDAGF